LDLQLPYNYDFLLYIIKKEGQAQQSQFCNARHAAQKNSMRI
jgi:hypothetical protein